MSGIQLALTTQERDYLIQFLTDKLRETEVEEHRTDSREYRERVVEKAEDVIQGLLVKLQAPK